MMDYNFPKDFIWGGATASHQVESCLHEDGAGLSNWEHFALQNGRIVNDDVAEFGPQQYRFYREDIKLMKELGIHAHRFSVAWPRIIPNADGVLNEKGLDYYDRFIDELLANDIQPWMTLFHWDFPQVLEEKFGGWRSKEIIIPFTDFAQVVIEKYSDRVKNFFTINEIMCFTSLSYGNEAHHAPGLKCSEQIWRQSVHNGLLAHGTALKLIREIVPDAKAGLVDNPTVTVPIIATEENIAAATKAFRDINMERLSPVFEGSYPQEFIERIGEENMPHYTSEELELISAPMDFVGYNVYAPTYVEANSENEATYNILPLPNGYPKLDMPWLNIGPDIIYYVGKHSVDLWNVENIFITENGCACQDKLTTDGRVIDSDRVLYLKKHLESLSYAIEKNIPFRGYFVWSLFDNYEWSWGFQKRFGIIYVNYNTKERIFKESAKFYKNTIKNNRVL